MNFSIPEMDKKPNLYLVIGAFAAIYIIWGSTYLFVKILVSELPPIYIASVRFILAGLIIFLMAIFFQKDWNLSRKKIRNAVIAGFFFLTLGNGGVSWALQYVDSGLAALVISAQPLVLLLMMWLLEGKKIKSRSWLGVALGMIGIYLLVSQNELVSSNNQWLGLLIIFGCLLSWGYGSLFVAKADLPDSFFINSGVQMLTGGISMFMVSTIIFREEIVSPFTLSQSQWLSLLYLVIFGSIIAFTSFNYLLKYVSPEKVSTSTYINPIIAMILGWAILDEVITNQSILAATILLVGVYFINISKGPSKTSKKV